MSVYEKILFAFVLFIILNWIWEEKIASSVLIYDIEVSDKAITGTNKVNKNAVITVIGFYDYPSRAYGSDFRQFRRFRSLAAKRKTIVSFNGKSFDDRICREHGIEVTTTFDLYEMVRLAAKQQTTHGIIKGYDLDTLGKVNFNMGKIKDAGLVEYNLQDIRITKKLWENRKRIKDPNSAKYLDLTKVKL